MIRGFVLLGVAVLFNGAANVLMKKGMIGADAGGGAAAMIKHYLTSWPLIVGLVLFAVNVIAYTQALSRLPLSVAYPIMVALTGVIVITGSHLLFKESIGWIQWAGYVLIVAGVVCVAR
ncbi:MAG: EamA family transporter [Proteobacteria bacterium]|jgi:multidrug transporter EmrE-like cation transporter|nr:EamA family transporter [Pseudomonadota bacterium]